MKLTSTKYYALNEAIQRVSMELGVNIYTVHTSRPELVVVYGVNWSAQGTKTPEEALEYAHKIIDASNIVKALNGLKIDYHIANDTEAEASMTREQYQKLVEAYKVALGCNMIEVLLNN